MTASNYFQSTYEEARDVFRNHLPKLQEKWPNAEIHVESIGKDSNHTIDVIYSPAKKQNEQVLFFTSGEHGIEGYAGAAMIHVFVDHYMDQVDPETTGICLIHALNPWGMNHYRRVTENNVDLNRNYLYNPNSVPHDVNEEYSTESDLFVPSRKINDVQVELKNINGHLAKALMEKGKSHVAKAKSMGQFEFNRGVYFGGEKEEESARYLKQWQRELLSRYDRVIHMDWHTALGPTNEITMVASEHDPREKEELIAEYQLKNVQKFTPNKVKGDSTNHFHKLRKEEYPETELFSALFEFGTFGTNEEAQIREFTTIILENQLYWEGAEQEEDMEWVKKEFRAMFYPDEPEWREAVLKEGRKGIEAVLKKERILA